MARKQVNDLQRVNLQGAARQVNTFVYGPRASSTNSALQLSEALKDAVEGIQDYKDREYKLDVAQATENKLYGGTLFTNAEQEAIADYEAYKDQLDTMDKAEAYFLERTTPEEPFQDAHQAAGYQEKQLAALGKFRGKHAEYLVQQKLERRTRDVFNDFYTNINDLDPSKGPVTPQVAFDRLAQIADNFGMNRKDTNSIPLGVAEVLISQGQFDKAEQILKFNRGPAGSLLGNPQTAIEAKKLMNSIDTDNSISVANQIKGLEDTTRAGQEFTPVQKAQMDKLLEGGNLTITQRNSLLEKNDEAVKVSRFSLQLADNLKTPGRTFLDPIEGATPEEAEKARKKFTQDFYNDAEQKRASGKIDPVGYSQRIARFSEQTNSVNDAVKERMGAGFSAFNPKSIIEGNEIDQQTLSAVGEYMMLYQQNAQVAAAHVGNEDTRNFYDAITMDVMYGGLPGSPQEKIDRAIKNYANDMNNPIKGTADLRVSDDEIIEKFRNISNSEAGVSFLGFGGSNTGPATNAIQWVPYIKAQVQAASRRTGGENKDKLIEHVVRQVVSRSQRVGDYLVPKGTNTFLGDRENIEKINNAAVADYISRNPEDGYEPDELVLVPIIGQQNLWGVSVKGSNQILEIVPHSQLPIGGVPKKSEPKPDKQSALETETNTRLAADEARILDFVAQPESQGNYNATFGGGEAPLTKMTVGEVLDLQKEMKTADSESTAVGRYQFINKTLKGLVKDLDIPKDAKFTTELQDRLAQELLHRRGLKDYRDGKISAQKFAFNLSQEWASLPKDQSGVSYYKGVGSNKALVRFQDVIDILT